MPATSNVVDTDPERPYTVIWCVSRVVRPANRGVVTEIVDLVDQGFDGWTVGRNQVGINGSTTESEVVRGNECAIKSCDRPIDPIIDLATCLTGRMGYTIARG